MQCGKYKTQTGFYRIHLIRIVLLGVTHDRIYCHLPRHMVAFSPMKLKFIPALLMFVSSYFPLALIFIIKDLNDTTFLPMHPIATAIVVATVLLACTAILVAVNKIESGIPVKITKVSNKSGDMFTYTIPYMISFFNFNLGDWKTMLSLFVFMSLMFALAYRTKNIFINPVLALAGYGLYDCQFKDGSREVQGLLISKYEFQLGDTCIVERLSNFMYFVSGVQFKEKNNGG